MTSSIRSVFNITPDRTSPAWLSSSAFSIPLSAGHGPWQTLIALDLPTTGLPVGTGKLRVSLGTGVTAPLIAHSPEGVDMALKILPDTGGMPNPFSYWAGWWEASVTTGSLNDLMPGKQYVVKTNLAVTGGNAVTYAAAEYHIYMPLRYKISGGIPDAEMLINNFVVILDNHPNFDRYQVGLRWHRDGDNIIVYITSPDRGGVDTQTRFSLVIDKTAPFDFLGTPSLTSVAYYDETGTVITTTRMPILQGINL